ncbi:MAG: GNAT family N-acetyltransferase [Deltaproteobacteria bacterium]|nr:GNAT family N-acetyltransferase [Deltaproteobacteria bacterium]
MNITYKSNSSIDLSEVIALYKASTLGLRRPVDDRQCMQQMMRHANLIVSAWDGTKLVGLARSLSDFAFCTYLSDLAVDVAYQHKGIGKELIRQTQSLGGKATIYLFSAPAAVAYYPKIGFNRGDGFILRADETIP